VERLARLLSLGAVEAGVLGRNSSSSESRVHDLRAARDAMVTEGGLAARLRMSGFDLRDATRPGVNAKDSFSDKGQSRD